MANVGIPLLAQNTMFPSMWFERGNPHTTNYIVPLYTLLINKIRMSCVLGFDIWNYMDKDLIISINGLIYIITNFVNNWMPLNLKSIFVAIAPLSHLNN